MNNNLQLSVLRFFQRSNVVFSLCFDFYDLKLKKGILKKKS